jgi:chromosome segregation protein
MKLKKLEITGFKSFSEKSDIEFPPGISAIVGPNGCGKSNIVDALRWAMGEQSVKQLRGKAMEDVIFAGTNGKPPLNMAEVSLILSNDNGSGPEEFKDYTEIMVTRRLFRSGESLYLINKHPCRLKDITNIFLGSGMGARSYSVIQQGNIGAITDAGPEERRFFIEEAAGITRYKQRKTEALRKIEATDQNLLRVKDIITEVERQMNSVKRQAKKAEKYKKYQEDIRELDVRVSLHHYDDYTRQIEETSALLRELRDADLQHVSKMKQLDAAVEDIKLKRWQKNQEISVQKADKFKTQRDIDKLENDIAHLRTDSERLNKETVELSAAHKDLEEKNKLMMSEIAEVEAEHLELERKIEDIKSATDKERRDSENTRDRLANMNLELDACKSNLMNLVAQEAKYKNIHQNAANNKESLKRRLKRADEEAAVAKKNVADGESRESKAREELELCRQEIEEVNAEISKARTALDEKSKALGTQVKSVQSLDFERSKTKSKYAALKKMEDNFDWYKGGVKAVMSLKEKEGGEGALNRNTVIALLADILDPEPGFESAAEAVLGEALQYILVRDQATGVEAVNYLQAQGAGRSGFVPVSGGRFQGAGCREQVAGVKKSAVSREISANRMLNHISVKPGFESVAETMLGNIFLAENMEQALAAHRRNGASGTFVTKAGDMISPQGIMIGGSKENLSGILAKKQEVKELHRQIASLEEKLETEREKQKDLESETRELENELQQLTEQRNQATYDETEAEKALYKVSEELKHARRHLDVARGELEQLQDEESGVEEEIEKYNKVLAEVENEIKTAQTRVAETTEKIAAVSAEMETYNQQMLDLKLEQTALNARLENSANSLRRLKQFREDGITRLEQLSRDIAMKEQKLTVSKQKISEYEQTLSAMYESMKSLEKSLELNETDFQSLDATLQESDTSISDIKTQREETLQKIRVMELEQSQRQLKRENISAQVEERYHKPLSAFRVELSGRDNLPMSVDKMESTLAEYRQQLSGIGDVNLSAIEEYEELKTRFDFLAAQRDDLVKAIVELQKVIKKINKITQERFLIIFEQVNEKLGEVFPRLFNGGSAKLELTEPNKPLETGVEFMVHPPGKKLTRLSLLSGGEKALSAIAFVFSIFLIKPAAFCIMDEIDAPLDEANVFRFNELLKIIGEKSQIIMITHKRKSMEFADMLFGVTMEKKGISKIVSVELEKG